MDTFDDRWARNPAGLHVAPGEPDRDQEQQHSDLADDTTAADSTRDVLDGQLRVLLHAAAVLRNWQAKRKDENPQ